MLTRSLKESFSDISVGSDEVAFTQVSDAVELKSHRERRGFCAYFKGKCLCPQSGDIESIVRFLDSLKLKTITSQFAFKAPLAISCITPKVNCNASQYQASIVLNEKD